MRASKTGNDLLQESYHSLPFEPSPLEGTQKRTYPK